MRRLFNTAAFLTLLLASCSPRPVTVAEPTGISSPTEITPPAHAPEIRFALIGAPEDVNVWSLFDEAGASYSNYALRSEYWPRLYHIAPQDSSFQPLAAQDMPSEVVQDGESYSATVKLRTDLKWTDGSPFTTEDVAFTVNTALAFELGYDWNAYYPPGYLLRAEAVDSSTVKYYFTQKPNVRVWQYGALQSPIVQKAYWASAVTDAANGLPTVESRAQIESARAQLATVQRDVDELSAQTAAIKLTGKEDRNLESALNRRTAELGFAKNNLDQVLAEDASLIAAAHEKIYQLDAADEPTLGAWIPGGQENGVWTNLANPDFPFGRPNFDRAVYRIYQDQSSALTAFQNGDADFVLSPNGIDGVSNDAKNHPSYSARFLVFNPLNVSLSNPAFRAALDCMMERDLLAMDVLQNKAAPLDSFVLSSQWHDVNVKDACVGMDKPARIGYAVKLLKDAGYSWGQEPNTDSAGKKMLSPDGAAFPQISLLAPPKEEDALRYATAKYMAEQAQYLGIPFSVREMSLNDIVYAVYSSRKYDMAIMGWRLSEYPAYMCEWVGAENLIQYSGSSYKSTCDALGVESDLDAARKIIQQLESGLMSELPFLPLFTETRVDVYRNLVYPPTANLLNGWSGLYGAPSYAMPSP